MLCPVIHDLDTNIWLHDIMRRNRAPVSYDEVCYSYVLLFVIFGVATAHATLNEMYDEFKERYHDMNAYTPAQVI